MAETIELTCSSFTLESRSNSPGGATSTSGYSTDDANNSNDMIPEVIVITEPYLNAKLTDAEKKLFDAVHDKNTDRAKKILNEVSQTIHVYNQECQTPRLARSIVTNRATESPWR